MRLSQNFFLDEFIISQTAIRLDINNNPGELELENLGFLINNVLQPLRDRIGAPVTITSGYRCAELNERIGGSRRSQHMKGEAADIVVHSRDLKKVFLEITENIEFDQIIYEYGRWIHVSFSEGNNRNNRMLAKRINGLTVYKKFEGSFE